VPDKSDPARTTDPPERLIAARAAMELIRILLPATVSIVLASAMFLALASIGTAGGLWLMVTVAPLMVICGGVIATLITVAIKWILMGRYRPGEHPLYSSYVWRDEIVNTCQEQLAGAWLLRSAAATPIVSIYLRMQGATVGRDVWFEPLTVTELDVAELGDGCVVNRNGVVETHLFHDRLMRIGPSKLGAGATLGQAAAMLPDTTSASTAPSAPGRSSCEANDCPPAPAGTVLRWWRSDVAQADPRRERAAGTRGLAARCTPRRGR